MLTATVFWGVSFIATKIALDYVPPLTVVAVRFGMGVVVLAVAAGVRRQFALLPAREVAALALLGAMGITFHQWLQTTGLVTARATTTAWIVSTTPIFIALLGAAALRERFGPRPIAGLLIATAGSLLVVSDGDWQALALGRIGAVGD